MNAIDWGSFAIGVFIGLAVTVVLFWLLMRRQNKQLDEISLQRLRAAMSLEESKQQAEDMARQVRSRKVSKNKHGEIG